jgi:thiol-disulfide isomerase/thioredoxin
MRKWIVVLSIITSAAYGQRIESVKLADLQKIIHSSSERILVINFWATWCAPCIKEIPLFEKLHLESKEVEVLLVSMDYDLDPNIQKVEKFQFRKKIQSRILFLMETDPNAWIEKIDKRWSGALPATLVINSKNGKREFVQRELEEGDLEKIVTKVTH